MSAKGRTPSGTWKSFALELRHEFLTLCGTRGGTKEEFEDWLREPAQRERLREAEGYLYNDIRRKLS